MCWALSCEIHCQQWVVVNDCVEWISHVQKVIYTRKRKQEDKNLGRIKILMVTQNWGTGYWYWVKLG